MKIFYDILDDLEKISSNGKETVVANVDSDNSNLDVTITVMPAFVTDKDEETKNVEYVLNAFESLIGEHSEVKYVDENSDKEITDEFKLHGYLFHIEMILTNFRNARQLWRFFSALFRAMYCHKDANILIVVQCGDNLPTMFNDFNRYTDFSQHYPYDDKKLIRGRIEPTFLDFGINRQQIKEWVDSLFEYNDHGMKRTEDKRPSYNLSKMYNFEED